MRLKGAALVVVAVVLLAYSGFLQREALAEPAGKADCPVSIDADAIPDGFAQGFADYTYTGFTWFERADGCICESGALAAFEKYAAEQRANGVSEDQIELSFSFKGSHRIPCHRAGDE